MLASSSDNTMTDNARQQVEHYAHALKARLQLASFKALHGVASSSYTQLDDITTTNASAKAADPQPISVTAAQPSSSSPITTPALSQAETMPCSSQSSSSSTVPKSTKSLYVDIFGTDFSKASPAPKRTLSRVSSVTSPSISKRSRQLASASTSNTPSLLDQTAESPQLGSPQRRNGRFDWHNNPTPSMIAREETLAATRFALPVGSPSKRRRETSYHPPGPSSLGNSATISPPRRTRVQSNGTGGFLPNGHPASSLAQDLGLTAPRTPRSRQTSAAAKHTFSHEHLDQDQEERDRVANTLAFMAESRTDSSSYSSLPSRAEECPTSSARKQKVTWSDKHGQDDRAAAADYLLYLASSPSPSPLLSSAKRLRNISGGRPHQAALLGTPAHTSLWDPFSDDDARSQPRSHAPMTPPPSTRKAAASASRTHQIVGLGLDADSMSPSPSLSSTSPSPELGSARASTPPSRASNAEEYMRMRTQRSPRTPPPSITHSRSTSAAGVAITCRSPGNAFAFTPPGAPGMDTNFHYADFLNVSPSPQPPSAPTFLTDKHAYLAQRTPTKSNRFRFTS